MKFLAHLEVEYSCIIILEALIWRYHAVEEFLVPAETGDGSQQPAVPKLSLLHVEATSTTDKQLSVVTDLLKNTKEEKRCQEYCKV